MTVVRAFLVVALAAVVAASAAPAAIASANLQPRPVEARSNGSPRGQQKEEAALDISGPWLFEVTSAAGTGTPSITFTQKGETLTGQYSGQLGEAPIQGTLKGADFTFSFDVSMQDTKLHVVYTGKAAKDSLKGTVVLGDFGEGTFTAHRK